MTFTCTHFHLKETLSVSQMAFAVTWPQNVHDINISFDKIYNKTSVPEQLSNRYLLMTTNILVLGKTTRNINISQRYYIKISLQFFSREGSY